MKVRLVFRLFALFSVLTLSAFADAQIDAWIAKARAALGSDSALDAVWSVHFKGTLETTQQVPSKADPKVMTTVPLRLGIDIVFQKPYRQRIVLRSDKVVETTALDGYDGWMRRADANKEDQWQLTLLDPNQIKRLRANTWENLSFYRGIERLGGNIQLRGEETVDGKPCVKLLFSHADNITFLRYFDKDTGRLVKTVTETGGEIREEGETIIDGVRYPKKLFNKTPTGDVTTITFDSIKVNENLPASEFAVPTLLPKP
ncbi:MAG: hypothetical protein HYV95_15255 [Opitutae bacterium]|nr:hypothetical protein [Opitutae bacterium]